MFRIIDGLPIIIRRLSLVLKGTTYSRDTEH